MKEDYLREDKPIPNQSIALVSFIEPEQDTLEKKTIYFMNQFLHHIVNDERRAQVDQVVKEVNSRIMKQVDRIRRRLGASENEDDRRLAQAFSDLSTKRIQIEEDEVRSSMLRQWTEGYDALMDKYKGYVVENHKELYNEFRRLSGNVPDVRGFKIRGVFPSVEEAVQKKDEIMQYDDTVDILSAEIGKWNIFNPDIHLIGNIEYMGGKYNELNELMRSYEANREEAKLYHEKRRQMDKQNSQQEKMTRGMKTLLDRKKAKLEKTQQTFQQMDGCVENDSTKYTQTEKNRKKREAKKRRRQQHKQEDEIETP